VTILIRLTLYISYIAPNPLSLNPLLAPLNEIARGFLTLFHLDIWSQSTIHPHFILHLPSPTLVTSTHTISILQSCLSLLIFKLIYRGISQCIPTVGILYFGPFFLCELLSFWHSFLPSTINISLKKLTSQIQQIFRNCHCVITIQYHLSPGYKLFTRYTCYPGCFS
jgi:hypothetical protein